MDRLIDAIAAVNNPSVVGLDPTPALLPKQLLEYSGSSPHTDSVSPVSSPTTRSWNRDDTGSSALANAYHLFNTTIIDAVSGIVPAVKVQIAMYEFLGPEGLVVYDRTCRYAQEHGMYVIGDIKRGDIGSTAKAYAAHLGGAEGPGRAGHEGRSPWHEDAITVNPYLGSDGIMPFIEMADTYDKDLFILVRTSNPSSSQIQGLELHDGMRLYEHVADLVEQWGAASRSRRSGYSHVGAVVGATHPGEGRELRTRMPHTFFLVPGYGAQGGTVRDVAGMFDPNASGAVVNSSRGIIGAWRRAEQYREDLDLDEVLHLVGTSARQAAIAMRDDLRSIRQLRNNEAQNTRDN